MKSAIITKKSFHRNQINYIENDIFIRRIPDKIYQRTANFLKGEFRFFNGVENGGRMRLSNYWIGISGNLANQFNDFIQEIISQYKKKKFPKTNLPAGFDSHSKTMTEFEANGGFSFGSFDMAVTNNGLKNIEFQAIATYPFTAVHLNQFVREELNLPQANIFTNNKQASFSDFKTIYQSIMGGKESLPVVLTDRDLKNQKTKFEFFATQKELGLPVDIVDIEHIFEKNRALYYKTSFNQSKKIRRLYSRILPNEAIFDDQYPKTKKWSLRYDKPYKGLKFINHPSKLFDVSKRLLPYVKHPFNPFALELTEAASDFLNGTLSFSDYVWKHKDGAAGFSLILSPTIDDLKRLAKNGKLSNYIAQKRVNYKIFRTDDDLEKIVELRFMTAHTNNKINIVPMARIGHYTSNPDNTKTYKIHFGDNNRLGYGFAPVLIF